MDRFIRAILESLDTSVLGWMVASWLLSPSHKTHRPNKLFIYGGTFPIGCSIIILDLYYSFNQPLKFKISYC